MQNTTKATLAAVGLAVFAVAAALPSSALRAQNNEGMGAGMSRQTMGSHQQMMGADTDMRAHGNEGEHGMEDSAKGHMMDGANGDHSMMDPGQDGMMGSDDHRGMMGR